MQSTPICYTLDHSSQAQITVVEIRDLASFFGGLSIFLGGNAPKKSGFITMDRVQIEVIKKTKAVLAGFIAGFWPN